MTDLKRRLAAAEKTIAVLMERVEKSTNASGNLHALLENNFALQEKIAFQLREQEELQRFNDNLEAIVRQRTIALDKANSELLLANRQLREMTLRDGLTGLFNRRHLEDTLQIEFERAGRYGNILSLIVIDLDFFKQVNDNHGHDFGDYVLQEFSRRLRQLTRSTDSCCRFGGEEFVVIMPQTTLEGATATGEKIRDVCRRRPFDNGQHSRTVTVSIGVAAIGHPNIRVANDLITLADKALYQAKHNGRDQVQVMVSDETG